MTCANSPSSPERAAASSAPCCSDGDSQPQLSGMPTASESSVRGAATWPTPTSGDSKASGASGYSTESGRHSGTTLTDATVRSPSTPTSATSTPSPDRATSSPEASPASRSVRPGNGSVRMTRATCGHTPFAYWSSQERRWDSSRTCLDFSAADTSEPFSETWPKRGSMRNGACWEQTMSVPRIDASGCGYWPSATATTRECTPEQWEQRRADQGGTLRSTYLQDAVKYQVEERSYPTPTADDANNVTRDSGQFQILTRIARGASTPQTETQTTSGSLSPLWVEFLMGWPPAWTDCEHLVTDKCLRRWQRLSTSWLRLLGYPMPLDERSNRD